MRWEEVARDAEPRLGLALVTDEPTHCPGLVRQLRDLLLDELLDRPDRPGPLRPRQGADHG